MEEGNRKCSWEGRVRHPSGDGPQFNGKVHFCTSGPGCNSGISSLKKILAEGLRNASAGNAGELLPVKMESTNGPTQ